MKKKLNIGLNLLYMNRKLSGGSITYGINLVNELALLDNYNNYIIYLNKDCENLPIKIGENFKKKILPFHNNYVYVRYFWEQLLFPFYLLNQNLDVLHSLGYVGPVFCPAKHIVSILDLNYKRHTESMSAFKRVLLGTMVKLMSIFSKSIITISNFSKEEIANELHVEKNKIIVTLLSGSSDVSYVDNSLELDLEGIYEIENEYIISFGSPSSHKNILGLISAFSIFNAKYSQYNLILVGHQHNNSELQEKIINLKLEDKVKFTGFVPDEHIFPLLKNAKLFVFPSFYEGFGIPLLDAQSAGVAVVSSNAASLPEVGGDSALYFDPNNVKEMASKFEMVLNDNDLSNRLIEKGFANRAKFSWHNTAKQTLQVYKDNV
ncbi:glycosyltransferase family 4 protein [Pedobacter psychrophilus]|nr:glycosyltransferase family 1 protein [Pedobacter psychrophilus]